VKKSFTIFIISLLASTGAMCQNYEQTAGLRMGAAGGITYRRILTPELSGELMMVSQNHGSAIVLLLEKHKPAVLFDDLNLNFIYGAGAHIGAANKYYLNSDHYNINNNYRGYNTLQLGFDGFASFEYLMPQYPVAVSLECKPYFEFFDNHFLGLHLPVIAFGARYVF
jgi:hypothetical protein